MDRVPMLCWLLCAASFACAQPAADPEPVMASSWTPPNAKFPPPKPGEPELHRAARVGDHEAIRRAVRDGTDINAVFDIGLDPGARSNPATPLMVAAGSGDGATIETVRLLLELGADPTLQTGGSTAAGFAATGLGWNYRPGGDAARLGLVLEAGSPLTVDGARGARLVGEAASSGDADRLGLLLRAGASPHAWFDAKEAEAEAARWQAMMKRHMAEQPPEIRAILESPEADISDLHQPRTAPSCYHIPLFQAAEGGSAACINILLQAGAAPDQLDDSRRTAMFYATSAEAVRALAAGGVDLTCIDEFDGDALDYLLDELGHDADRDPSLREAARAMIEVGIPLVRPPEADQRLYTAAFRENLEATRFLLELGHPIMSDASGRTALHAICWQSDHGDERDRSIRDIVRVLLAAGIDPNAREANGNTPLHECVSGCLLGANIVAAELLIEAGADVNARNSDGQTPVVYLYETRFEYAKVVPFLLKHGADPLIPNARGQNALDLARATAAGEEPAWREEMLEDLPPDHPAQSTGWKSPAEPGDEESQVLKLLEEAAKRPRK